MVGMVATTVAAKVAKTVATAGWQQALAGKKAHVEMSCGEVTLAGAGRQWCCGCMSTEDSRMQALVMVRKWRRTIAGLHASGYNPIFR